MTVTADTIVGAISQALCCDAEGEGDAFVPNDWDAGVKVGELMELVHYVERLIGYLSSAIKYDPGEAHLISARALLMEFKGRLLRQVTDIGAELADR